jgi:hypothetical protein
MERSVAGSESTHTSTPSNNEIKRARLGQLRENRFSG